MFPSEPVVLLREAGRCPLPAHFLLSRLIHEASNKKRFEALSSGIIGFLIGITNPTPGAPNILTAG
jgi:hypothetical protein